LVDFLVHGHGEFLSIIAAFQVLIDRKPTRCGIVSHLLDHRGLSDAPLSCDDQALLVNGFPQQFDQLVPANGRLAIYLSAWVSFHRH